jgi:primosomal protein N'
MAICPHCEKPVTLTKGELHQVCRQTEGTAKKEVMYSCPHCDKVMGFAFFLGGMLTGRP